MNETNLPGIRFIAGFASIAYDALGGLCPPNKAPLIFCRKACRKLRRFYGIPVLRILGYAQAQELSGFIVDAELRALRNQALIFFTFLVFMDGAEPYPGIPDLEITSLMSDN